MTIDEAISHALEVAEKEEQLSKTGKWFEGEDWNEKARGQCAECAAEHRQLAEWLTDYKELREENKVLMQECDRLIKEKGKLLKQHEHIAEYKRLLDLAHHDLRAESICRNCKWRTTGLDTVCRGCRGEKWEWAHADEALKLIGENDGR